ncbi:hypothetical protein FC40_GL001475 [Ligilactobacillus hayakitensis DSM 18933 = JCM 14209]|uniref:Uncharacterized protein n=1 Tax=Ligilactobacillus hayakitensis DSM 18933 = JCM 14209 TaxID=1423755 RepID=A0A0R1WNX2_9LACO|nr:hypothetical protein FC40_GL001475 [Ligilactobacillus hayakitensis DSM 18933 = JCM 14209]
MIALQIAVESFINAIESEEYTTKIITGTMNDVDQLGIAEIIDPVVSTFADILRQETLAQVQLVLDGLKEPIFITLESGIINLPFSNISKVDNFYSELTQEVPVVVNLVVAHSKLNASGLRIDTLGNVTDFLSNPAQFTMQIITSVAEKIATIQNAPDDEQEESDE